MSSAEITSYKNFSVPIQRYGFYDEYDSTSGAAGTL
jgi:hypothetical protein